MTDSLHSLKPPIGGNSISQVSSAAGSGKRYAIGILMAIVVIMLIWSLFGGVNKEKAKADKSALKPNYHSTNHSDAMTNTDDPNQELDEKMRQVRLKMDMEKQAQQEKMFRMRQAAPVEMYVTSVAVNPTPSLPSGVDAASGTSGAGGNLPLSTAQVEKLKGLLGNTDPNTQFQQTASNSAVETVGAGRIAHPDYTVTQGTLIAGTLQTAINSDLPGMVKATVSMDVYGAAGERVLIPKGSILIGQYNSGISMGQERVFVVWTRVIRPDGVDVLLGSPGTDSLGQGGLGADQLDTHFLARFGQATLLSIIGAGIDNVGVNGSQQYNSASAYRTAIANNFQNVASSALMTTMNIKPTIHVDQGAQINVFVNRDISFYNTLTGGA